MVNFAEVYGYAEFQKYVECIDPNCPPTYFYFSGSKLPSGESWCPDCAEAEPVVKAFFCELNKDVTFVYVDVGDRDCWKDKANPFRTDSRVRLMVIPTIIVWNGVQRLEGSQCNKRDLLQMLFEDEE